MARTALAGLPLAAGARAARGQSASSARASGTYPGASDAAYFPRLDPERVRATVGAAHTDLEAVRDLVTTQPALARASWDWAFGDWESALGAASHMGRRDIAELLLAHGARPTLFSAAMLGQLAVVRAFVEASPGVQGTLGPHGLTLLSHARAGGPGAAAVVRYLEEVGGANAGTPTQPLDAADRDALIGEYRPEGADSGVSGLWVVDLRNNQLGISFGGDVRRFLLHTGDLRFFPSGVPETTITFTRSEGRSEGHSEGQVSLLTIADGVRTLVARRVR